MSNIPVASTVAVAALTAESSMSMADVDFNQASSSNKNTRKCSLLGWVTLGWGGATALLAILAMALTGAPVVVIISSVVALLLTPVVLLQRYQLLQMDTFREVHNRLRQDVGRLHNENVELGGQVDRLGEQANRVKSLEGELNQIVTTQGKDVNTFLDLIKDNAEALAKMEVCVKNQVVQQIMNILCTSDRDQDFHIDPHEVNELLHRLQAVPGVEAVDIDQLRSYFTDDGTTKTLDHVLELIYKLQQDPNQNIISISSRRLSVPRF